MLRRSVGVFLLMLGVAQASCDHPYYPVHEGWTWTYQTGGPQPSSYQMTQQKVTSQSFTTVMKLPEGFEVTSTWDCKSDGLQSLDSGMFNQPGMEGFKVNKFTTNGIRVPAASQWKLGAKWTFSYGFEGEMAGMRMNVHSDVQEEIVAQEQVTVPAGTFQAWKVKSVVKTLSQNPELASMLEGMKDQLPEGVTLPGMSDPVVVTSFSWMVAGVGLVKSETDGIVTELVKLQK